MNDTRSLLVDCDLEMNSMTETKETLWTIFTWTIMNYSELTEDISYIREENFLQHFLSFSLIKKENSLHLTFKASRFASLSIIGKNDQVLNGEQTWVAERDVIISKFRNDVLLDPNSGYLNDDTLVVQCKYPNSGHDVNIRVIPWDEYRERKDLAHFQNEWREMYLQSRFCDFKIIVEGNVFYSHKVILGARSGYFAYRFEEEEVERYAEDIAEISGPPYVFHEVLMFMYTGELLEMSLASMLDVFELANLLIINSLLQKCICMFRECMKEENVISVCAKAEALEYYPLVYECLDFMKNRCSNQQKKYKEMKNKGLEHLARMKIVK